MKELLKIQDQFQAYLLNENPEIESAIVSTEKVSIETRLMIYGNAYRLRLLEVLESSFPVLKKLMGDEDFYQLGHEYIDSYPSTYRSIRWFGDELAAFLQENYSDQPWFAELAAVEWTMSLVFDAADGAILTVNDIAQLSADSWESLQIQFVPSVHRLNVCWNVFPIWQALSEDQQAPELTSSLAPMQWVLWRNELINHYASQAEDQACVMNKIMDGARFGEVCESLCEWMDEEQAVMRAATLLRGWVDSGMIKKF